MSHMCRGGIYSRVMVLCGFLKEILCITVMLIFVDFLS